MLDERTGKDLSEYPVLNNGKVYIYVMLNEVGKIKIGLTTNIEQRYKSLCGSNCAGDKIIKVLVSPSTYLKTIEKTMHNHFYRFQIKGTEWFYDKNNTGELTFEKACEYLHLLFSSPGYKLCNETRKRYVLKEMEKKDKEAGDV